MTPFSTTRDTRGNIEHAPCFWSQAYFLDKVQLTFDVFSLVYHTKRNLCTDGSREESAWRRSRSHMVINRCSHGATDSNIRWTAGLRARSCAVCPEQSLRLRSALCKRNIICTQLSCPAAELRCRARERPKNLFKGFAIDNIELLFASVSGSGLIKPFHDVLVIYPRVGGGGGASHMKRSGTLVGKFELNP